MRIPPFVAYVMVVFAAMAAVWALNNRSITVTHDAEMTACKRVQILRDQANGTNILVYDTFKRVVDQQKAALKGNHLTGVALKQAKDSVRRAQKVVDTTVVTGPTDCLAAVNHPGTYLPPAPEFIKSNTKRVQIARQRAMVIVEKAKTQTPLYDPEPNRIP